MLTRGEFTSMVDHTLLAATATERQILDLCAEARDLGTFSVCVNGAWTRTVTDALDGSGVLTCTVVGFPLGAMSPHAIAAETRLAIGDGASEIDMVAPLGRVIAGDEDTTRATIAAVRRACPHATLKVIVETAALTDDQIRLAAAAAVAEGADFVKTSTGFHAAGGATEAAVRLLRECVGEDLGVKASGGIRTVADVEAMVAAGATRLGMSATTAVAAELG